MEVSDLATDEFMCKGIDNALEFFLDHLSNKYLPQGGHPRGIYIYIYILIYYIYVYILINIQFIDIIYIFIYR